MIKKTSSRLSSSLIQIKKQTPGEYTFNKLNGVMSFYKPPDLELYDVFKTVIQTFVGGFNLLPCRPIENIVKINKETNLPFIDKNFADSVEALGPRFIRKDFRFDFLHPLDKHDSGVIIGSINDKSNILEKLENMRLMRVYEIKGRMGVLTDDFTPHGRLLDRASYLHVNHSKIDRLMSSIQATYQREMFKYAGINIQSQEAYELASKGPLRPINTKTPPQIYSIRCIEFDRPFFKIEIHTINESTRFLRNLINDIGVRLKCYAICVQIRRIKDGCADVKSSLAFNEWKDFELLLRNNQEITQKARDFIKNFDKTVLIGKTKEEELKEMNRKFTSYLIDTNQYPYNKTNFSS